MKTLQTTDLNCVKRLKTGLLDHYNSPPYYQKMNSREQWGRVFDL